MGAFGFVRPLLRRVGVEVIAHEPRNFPHLRRAELLSKERVDVVLDVGASDGDWARGIRSLGFRGRIISFEPLEDPPARDRDWEWHRVALGDESRTAVLRVTGNRQSSSLLPMAEAHLRHAPESAEVGQIEVEVARLDELGLVTEGRAYLKLDVQGAELAVLRGAQDSLEFVRVVEVELSVVELYRGQALVEEVIGYLRSAGFDPIGIETSFRDRRSGDLLQANGFFRRRR
ncbi:MAG: FkbM family methyltransferase [Gaiellaceae bacterium]|jgi:FkbM family methyltransferase